MVHSATSLDTPWDGRDQNGNQAKEDVYVWKVKVKSAVTGQEKAYYGHVTLIR